MQLFKSDGVKLYLGYIKRKLRYIRNFNIQMSTWKYSVLLRLSFLINSIKIYSNVNKAYYLSNLEKKNVILHLI